MQWCRTFNISIFILQMSASTFKTHLTWPLEEIFLMSWAPPLLPRILWKAIMTFFYGFYIQPESPEDPAQQVRVKGIGLQMPSCPPRGGQIGWGSGWLYHCFFFLLPWQRATHTHMSLQEVLQVKARFNGCFSDSLSESSLFGGVTEVLTDCKSSDKEQRGKKDTSC